MALKAALSHPAWYALVVVGYLASFVFLTLCLRAGLPIGVAYGIWAATGVALSAILAKLIFGEALTPVMALGIMLIAGGVVLVELGHASATA